MNSLPLADEFSEKLPRYSAAGFVDDPRGPRGTRFSFFDSMGRTRQRSIERDERSEACPGGNRVNLHAERISEGGKSRGGERERDSYPREESSPEEETCSYGLRSGPIVANCAVRRPILGKVTFIVLRAAEIGNEFS